MSAALWSRDTGDPRASLGDLIIIYTPNLGLGIAISVREREQGCFRGSSKGARGSSGDVVGKQWGSVGEHRRSNRESIMGQL